MNLKQLKATKLPTPYKVSSHVKTTVANKTWLQNTSTATYYGNKLQLQRSERDSNHGQITTVGDIIIEFRQDYVQQTNVLTIDAMHTNYKLCNVLVLRYVVHLSQEACT